jgi:hypothetical protein
MEHARFITLSQHRVQNKVMDNMNIGQVSPHVIQIVQYISNFSKKA